MLTGAIQDAARKRQQAGGSTRKSTSKKQSKTAEPEIEFIYSYKTSYSTTDEIDINWAALMAGCGALGRLF